VNGIVRCLFYSRGGSLSGDIAINSRGANWSAAQYGSVARMTAKNYTDQLVISDLNYMDIPWESMSRRNTGMNNFDANDLSDIDPSNYALWCEIKGHSFTAKDPDKTIIARGGERKLGCGPCITALFGAGGEVDQDKLDLQIRIAELEKGQGIGDRS
jgi:hypothetical protein